MAKKILAVLLALSFVVAFAACGGKEENVTTTLAETTEDPFAVLDETEAPAVDETVADETAAATEAAVSDPTAAVEDTTAAEGDTTVAASGEATTEAANAMPEGKEAIIEYKQR